MFYQMIFFGLGANLTVHSCNPSVLLVDVSGRRSFAKHVVRKSERTLQKKTTQFIILNNNNKTQTYVLDLLLQML